MTIVQRTADKIKTKAYWAVTIRPADYREARVPTQSQLFEIVHDTAVSINGRTIPNIDGAPHSLVHGSDWIELSTDWDADIQSWRFYQSGQFVLLLAVWTDWDEQQPLKQVPPPKGRTFPIWDSLGTFVAIYEFAARLSLTVAGSEHMVISTKIENLQGAQLVQDNLRKTSLRHCEFRDNMFVYPSGGPAVISRLELVGDTRRLAAEAANELLCQFGFNSSPEAVLSWQSEF